MIRTFLRGINVSFLLLIIISTLSSCANEMNIFEGNDNRQINFSVSVPEWKATDSLATTKISRATPIGGSSLSTSNTFNLIADQNDGAGNYSTLIDKESVSFTNNIWQTNSSHYYWSGIANKTISFYAYYPSTISNVSHTAGSSPTLSYTVPDNVSDQIDIVTAANNNVSGSTNSSTSLTFNHIFAAVQFNIGSSGMPNGTITGISLNNILCKGTYNFNGTWTQDATTKKSFSQAVSSSTTGNTVITSGATTFMMMPQTLGSDASITVTYSNGGTLTKSIAGTWTAGNIYSYNISKTIPVANFDYTGYVQTYTVPLTGTYKLEVWGAEGGNMSSHNGGNGGKGGYSYGTLRLLAKSQLYIAVGGYIYNGGGQEGPTGPGGGGATHIATNNRGELKNYRSYQSEILIVAGGGGSCDDGTPGYGGGLSGGNGDSGNYYGSVITSLAYGGTQTSSGANAIHVDNSVIYYASDFGQGGYGYIPRSDGSTDWGGAGGGGWYGGGGSPNIGSGGGGSGHIGTGVIGTTIAGNQSIPSPSGGTETGHSGNGYARITFVSAN